MSNMHQKQRAGVAEARAAKRAEWKRRVLAMREAEAEDQEPEDVRDERPFSCGHPADDLASSYDRVREEELNARVMDFDEEDFS